jgi:hypothetical protein
MDGANTDTDWMDKFNLVLLVTENPSTEERFRARAERANDENFNMLF